MQQYSGPIAESLPSSVSTFSHRRARAPSTTSFTYYEEEPEALSPSHERPNTYFGTGTSDGYGRCSFSEVDDSGDSNFSVFDDEDQAEEEFRITHDDYVLRRCSSAQSHISARAGLLRRDSTATAASSRHPAGRNSQKVYMTNEDLTIAIAGFRTGHVGYAAYILLCILSCGIALLLFRWLPRWYVGVVGQPWPLKDCDWVVIENQWGELAMVSVKSQLHGRPVSTVFGPPEKIFSYGLDEENDPLMDKLRMLDYRYVRLCYHPLKDKFVLSAGWKDPEWTDIRLVRCGLDSDEKALREVVFGRNLIDIEAKSSGQILVDEVSSPRVLGDSSRTSIRSCPVGSDEECFRRLCIRLTSFKSPA